MEGGGIDGVHNTNARGRKVLSLALLLLSLILPQVSRMFIHPLIHKVHPAVLLVPDAASLLSLLACGAGLAVDERLLFPWLSFVAFLHFPPSE
jgi:hypothetical protein